MDKKWRLILIHLTLLFFVSCSVKWLLVKCSKWLWSLFRVSLMWSSKTWCLSWLCLLPAGVWSSKQAVVDVAVTVSLAAEMSVNLFFQSFALNVSSSDSLLISVAGMAVYTGYVFMPQHIMAILHYFEVVQWHEGRAHQPTGPVCLWLPVRPPVHLPADLSVSWAWGRDCFQPGRTSSSLLLFQNWLISKVKTLKVVLEVCWTMLLSGTVSPSLEYLGLWTCCMRRLRRGCAWFVFMSLIEAHLFVLCKLSGCLVVWNDWSLLFLFHQGFKLLLSSGSDGRSPFTPFMSQIRLLEQDVMWSFSTFTVIYPALCHEARRPSSTS